MKHSDVAELISTARAYDDRIEAVMDPYWNTRAERWELDARVTAWHMILGDLDVNLALQGLVEMYQQPQMLRLQPGHIREAAERVRSRNVEQADLAALIAPDELAVAQDGWSRSAQWRQAAIDAVGRGASIDAAQQHADDTLQVSRRQIGPPVRRNVLELVQRVAGESA